MIKMKCPPSVFALFFIFFTLYACKDGKAIMPIPKETMVTVLADIHMAEAYIESVSPALKDSMAKQYYPQIFKHNGITAKLYDSAFSVLSNQPDLMKSIYDDVLTKIDERQKIMKGDTLKTTNIDSTKKN